MSDTDLNNANDTGMDTLLTDAFKKVIGFMKTELILRGILFLLLGLLILFHPVSMLLAITIAIGVFVLLDGITMLFPALRYQGGGKGLLILNAILFILLGVFTCVNPVKMDLIWVVMIGFWQLFGGIHSFTLTRSAGAFAVFSGIFGIISGLVLIFMPFFALPILIWIMGFTSIIDGLFAIILGIRLKQALK